MSRCDEACQTIRPARALGCSSTCAVGAALAQLVQHRGWCSNLVCAGCTVLHKGWTSQDSRYERVPVFQNRRSARKASVHPVHHSSPLTMSLVRSNKNRCCDIVCCARTRCKRKSETTESMRRSRGKGMFSGARDQAAAVTWEVQSVRRCSQGPLESKVRAIAAEMLFSWPLMCSSTKLQCLQHEPPRESKKAMQNAVFSLEGTMICIHEACQGQDENVHHDFVNRALEHHGGGRRQPEKEQHDNRRGGRELLDRKCQRAASLTQVRLIGDKFLRALSLTSIPPSSSKTQCAFCSNSVV